MILLFYPVLSALPQEIVFRPLFFRRYGAILPDAHAGIVVNAALFPCAPDVLELGRCGDDVLWRACVCLGL